MPLGLLDNRRESRRLGDGEIGQDLAIHCDAGADEAGDEARIGQAVLAHRRVDALNPQGAEFALAVLAIAVGVLQRLVDRGLGGADRVLAPAEEALGGFQNLLMLGVGSYAAFYASHFSKL